MNQPFEQIALDFFSKVDLSRQFLLIGDTNHDCIELRRFILSEQFLRMAAASGYKFLFIEISHDRVNFYEKVKKNALSFVRDLQNLKPGGGVQNELQRILKSSESYQEEIGLIKKWFKDKNFTDEEGQLNVIAYFLSEYIGIEVIPADARTEKEKREKSAILKKAEEQKDIESINNILDDAYSKDDRVLDFITSRIGSSKAIVFYGAGHFNSGRFFENAIEKDRRVIINLWQNRTVLERDPKKNIRAADAINYVLPGGNAGNRVVLAPDQTMLNIQVPTNNFTYRVSPSNTSIKYTIEKDVKD